MNRQQRLRFAQNINKEHRWIISYADFLTLLFAFFAFLFSISTLEDEKFQQVSQTLLQLFDVRPSSIEPIELNRTPTGPDIFNPLYKPEPLPGTDIDNANTERYASESSLLDIKAQLNESFEQLIRERLFSVSGNESWIQLQLSNSVSFSENSADINDQAEAVLYEIGKLLTGLPMPVSVEGFSSEDEDQGWVLSSQRAVAVVQYLQNAGVRGERLSATAFASFQPRMTNDVDSTDGRIQIVVSGFAGAEQTLE